jgi:nicotinamide riboside kinase
LKDRVAALQSAANRICQNRHDRRIIVWDHFDDNAPQTPSTDEEWNYWKDAVGYDEYDYFVASEPYGKQMAKLIGAEFVPFDIDRQLLYTKGSDVRRDLSENFFDVLPEMRQYLRKTVTIFGQESTGKTTLTNYLGTYYPNIHEFARPYLEMQDTPDVTPHRMATIMRGQHALQKTAEIAGSYLTIQDTDLLSTIGYYRIMGIPAPEKIFDLFEETKSDLYIVTPDNIPFEPDPLRYGGNERESTLQFWIDLLDEFGCNYNVLQSSDMFARENEVDEIIASAIEEWTAPIRDFVRE